jgi:uroporphyrinogen-III decarboxylase
LGALMGFEEAMIAMMEEPEACYELFSAVTDYKIKLAEKAAKYYKADVFMNFDDIATERNLFMSPETYRRLLKPQHKKLNDAVRNLGMIPYSIPADTRNFVLRIMLKPARKPGAPYNPTNDIAAILDKYSGQFCMVLTAADAKDAAEKGQAIMETANKLRFAGK